MDERNLATENRDPNRGRTKSSTITMADQSPMREIDTAPVSSPSNPTEVSTPVRTNRVKTIVGSDGIDAVTPLEGDHDVNGVVLTTPPAKPSAEGTTKEEETTRSPRADGMEDGTTNESAVSADGATDDEKSALQGATLTEKTAPMLAKLSSWGKQANANAKDFWSKRRVTSAVFSDTIKKSLPLTTASLEVPTPTSKGEGASTSFTTDEERKEDAEAKESETSGVMSQDDSRKLTSFAPSDHTGPGGAMQTPDESSSTLRTPPDATTPSSVTAAQPPTSGQSSLSSALFTPVPLRTVETAPASMLSMGSLLSPQSTRSGISDDASSSFVSAYDDDTVSSYLSSTYTSDDGTVRGTLKWAAASVVDSMQTYRGRYNRSGSDWQSDAGPNVPNLNVRTSALSSDKQHTPPGGSQTHRMLQSRAKQHLQDLMEGLEPNEYLMLLGHGMLGVNLKPTYLKNGGVFVDYLVKGGAAQKSNVICPGDSLCRIGELDVRKGNILQVPNQIAQARRPIHLIFSTGLTSKDRINYIDIATALLHKFVQTTDRPSVVRFEEPIRKESEDRNGQEDSNSVSAMELVKPTSFDNNETREDAVDNNSDDKNVPNVVIASEGLLRPVVPSPGLRQAFLGIAAQRCNEPFFRADRLWSTVSVSTDSNLLRALKHAFILTTADGRRLAFLVRQWSKEDDLANQVGSSPGGGTQQPPETQFANSPNAMLMLYLELFQFVDLYGVTPVERRRSMAQKIANKFFLPVAIGSELVPPMLDFHHVVSDASLRQLEAALKDESTPIEIDLFQDFQEVVLDSLAGQHFLSFLVSDECSRMRAYMRNTAPFLNVPLDRVVHAVTEDQNPFATNYLLYVIVYLLSQADPEEVGETSEILDSKKESRTRIDDAAASICASIFIERTLLKTIRTINEKKNKETMKQLFEALETFWELFMAPAIGSLDTTSLSAETRAKVNMLRSELEQICAPCRTTSLEYDDEASIVALELTVAQLTETQLVDDLVSLAGGLLYDYAVIGHSNFRVHKIHEWMCQEAVKANSEKEDQDAIPCLEPQCIKRLLRKAHLPKGVSSHKPFNSFASGSDFQTSTPPVPEQCTAECAVVFGSSIGLDYEFRPPAGEEGSVRRYACQSMSLDNCDFTPDEMPPTLESYATVPLNVYQQPFRGYFNSPLESVDGWEVSLLSFKVPRVDSTDDNEDSSLYGVSLVLRRLPNQSNPDQNTMPTSVIKSPTNENSVYYEGSQESGDLRRIVAVECECTLFKDRMQSQSWREVHSSKNAMIGIALVSRHCAIPSMQQALENLLKAFCSNGEKTRDLFCNGLADFLGTFEHGDVEIDVLRDFVSPCLQESLKPWLERPFGAQQLAFERDAGEQLINSLPPIPLALLFVTALLEQKIVITGSRRSILLSATTALTQMLKPLKWCHLIVPRVPSSLAADLLQYPAPFILGMPAQDPGTLLCVIVWWWQLWLVVHSNGRNQRLWCCLVRLVVVSPFVVYLCLVSCL